MYRYILFDLDGTLTDPQEGIINSIQFALSQLGVTREKDDLLQYIGPPLHQSFRQFFDTEEEVSKAIALYREYFVSKGMYENVLYPGIPQLLVDLKAKDKRLFVATSKPTIFAQQILEHFEVANYFEAIVGSNLDGSLADKEEIVQSIIELIPEAAKNEILMVGDREHDVIGARYHGIDCAAVTFGYGSKEELETEGAAYIVDTVSALNLLLCSK